MEELVRCKQGQRVRDCDGLSGEVRKAEDPHNVEVDLDGGGFAYYCIVQGCESYSPLEEI